MTGSRTNPSDGPAPGVIAAATKWEDQLPRPPEGTIVVLHSRVVTETGGGPDKTILLSAPYLAGSRYWVAAAYMYPPGDAGFQELQRRAEAAGCPLIGVPDRGPWDWRIIGAHLRLCRKLNVRIWHGHDYKSNLLGLLLRRFWKMKLVTTVHGWVKHTRRTPLYYSLDRACLRFYDHVIAVSDDLERQVLRLGVRRDRCTLLFNGVDEQVFQRRRPAQEALMREAMKTPAGRQVIGGMGRLSEEKAFDHLIRAAAELVRRGLDIELWIAGEGEEKEKLQRLAEELGVAERVRLLGFCRDTVAFYEALDVFCLSSLREGLPNVVLEAMAMGLAVVATSVAGVPRLIENGGNGLLVPPGEVPALSQALAEVLTDPDLRTRLGSAARATIERGFTFRQRMAKERAIYDQLLGLPAEGNGPRAVE